MLSQVKRTMVVASVSILTMLCGCKSSPITIRGATLREDSDPRKQLPIAGVEVSAGGIKSKSDDAGYFTLSLPPLRPGQELTLEFRRAEYQPLDLPVESSRPGLTKLYVARLIPAPHAAPAEVAGSIVANVLVRYSTKSTSTVAIGSATKTFEAANVANVRCIQGPCSPDGKWKAATGSAALDAGDGNEFRDARVSCIAGPCPFTKVISDEFSRGGQHISVTVLNWSDTTTFLLQAEVYHPMASNLVRRAYPVIFGQTLDFTLPANAEGACLEAEINGWSIVFPLGPALILSWADCNSNAEQAGSRIYRCDLKPGYRFK